MVTQIEMEISGAEEEEAEAGEIGVEEETEDEAEGDIEATATVTHCHHSHVLVGSMHNHSQAALHNLLHKVHSRQHSRNSLKTLQTITTDHQMKSIRLDNLNYGLNFRLDKPFPQLVNNIIQTCNKHLNSHSQICQIIGQTCLNLFSCQLALSSILHFLLGIKTAYQISGISKANLVNLVNLGTLVEVVANHLEVAHIV